MDSAKKKIEARDNTAKKRQHNSEKNSARYVLCNHQSN